MFILIWRGNLKLYFQKLKNENSDIEKELKELKENNTNEMDEYNIWLRAKEKLEKAI